jgi:predicted MFS family arabinose efflux permease
MIITFLSDYLSQNKGLSVEQATFVLLLLGIGGAVGVLAGGAAGQLMYKPRWATGVLIGADVAHPLVISVKIVA